MTRRRFIVAGEPDGYMGLSMTVGETVDALGGNAAVAQVMGVGESAVRNWRMVGRFPAKTYFAFVNLAREKQVFLDETLFVGAVNGKTAAE
jgi:hypothetical protein